MDLSKSVIYQVYLRTFTSDGTLKAAEEMIPHLCDLGIDIIYLSACNKEDTDEEGQSKRQIASGMNNPKNPYRITDYFDVDEEYGTLDDLKSFVSTAHSYGIRVLIDLVYLHCGKNAVFLEEHPEFVIRDENGQIIWGESWPFARFNYDEIALKEYLWTNMEFYIREIKADGFRCDVADGVPLDFWQEGVKRVKNINPDIIMINEGSNPDYFSAFDINYTARIIHGINDLFVDTEKKLRASENESNDDEYMTIPKLKETINHFYKSVPDGKYILSNAENHDVASDGGVERPEIYLGGKGAEAIMTLVFTLKGVPMIYNGCEVADDTLKCMFWNRFCEGVMSVRWQNVLTEKGRDRIKFLKELIGIRKSSDALCNGDLIWDEQTMNDNIICFERLSKADSVTVIINTTSQPQGVAFASVSLENVMFSSNVEFLNNEIRFNSYGFAIIQN